LQIFELIDIDTGISSHLGTIYYKPCIKFKIRFNNLSNFTLLLLNAEADVYAQAATAMNVIYMGRAYPKSYNELSRQVISKGRIDFDLILPVDYHAIERIESLRKGGRVRFHLIIRSVATAQSIASSIGQFYQVVQLSGSTSMYMYEGPCYDVKTGSSYTELSVDEWVEKVINKLGMVKVKVLEVPVIQVKDNSLASALSNLDKAWELMLEDYAESLNASRKALEDIKNYLKRKGYTKTVENKEKIDFKKLYGGERIGNAMDKLFKGLWELTDIGSHTGRSKLITRADMELVITSIYMLIKSILHMT